MIDSMPNHIAREIMEIVEDKIDANNYDVESDMSRSKKNESDN